MKVTTLLELFSAGHIARYVQAPPQFQQRGGQMIVGPAGILKTTMIETALEGTSDCMILSDVNVDTLLRLREDIITNRYNTIAFAAFEKLYQRHSSTSSNIEGSITGLVEEGFRHASFEEMRGAVMKARAHVIGAMPYKFYKRHIGDWIDSGFARRFIWFFIAKLNDNEALINSIHRWEPLEFGNGYIFRRPTSQYIKYDLSDSESKFIESLIRQQEGHHGTAFTLLKKVACVLKWKYNTTKMHSILEDARRALSYDGDELELE